ncbi:MAG: hypothetical protein LBP99_02365 [Azoarcus sp.]|jgi:hypothetical protein|nr:hypothetical protein [Azoarcus sp.]
MFSDHDLESAKKAYYTPLEAAIRLSGQIRHGKDIRALVGNNHWPGADECARWPALYLSLSRLRDALLHGELACCKAGIVCKDGPLPLDDPELTIRHVDLRRWIESCYPEEAPAFLFGKGYVPLTISDKAYRVLCAELEAKRIELERCNKSLKAIHTEHDLLKKRHQLLAEKLNHEQGQDSAPYRRRVSTLLSIIGGLTSFLVEGPISKSLSLPFRTQQSLIEALVTNYPKRSGMSRRTLDEKFADAKKLIEEAS